MTSTLGGQMQFRLLGPLEVSLDDRPLDLGAPRQQVIVAMLILEANHVVPMSRLIDAIWTTTRPPPPRARSRSASRRCAACSATLRAAARESSRDRPAMCSRSPMRPTTSGSSSCSRRAAGPRLPRGASRRPPPTCGLPSGSGGGRPPPASRAGSSGWQRPGSTKPGSRCSVTTWSSNFELGHHRDVIGELTSLVAEYPLHERLRTLLMLALYRAGRGR